MAVLKCLGYGNVERAPSQWICFPGWRKSFLVVVSQTPKMIGLTPRAIPSREIHPSQCGRLSSLGAWEGNLLQVLPEGPSSLWAGEGWMADGLAAETISQTPGSGEQLSPVCSRGAARPAVIVSFARSKYPARLWQNWRASISQKHLLCFYCANVKGTQSCEPGGLVPPSLPLVPVVILGVAPSLTG